VTALRDLHIDNRSLAGNLAGIVSQRLVRRVCRECCRMETPTEEERLAFNRSSREIPEAVPRAVGCDDCRQTGYFERVGVFEVASGISSLSAAILQGVSEADLRMCLRRCRVPTLVDDGLDKVAGGITTVSEVAASRPGVAGGRSDHAPPVPSVEGAPADSHRASTDAPTDYRVVIFAAPDDAFALRDLFVEQFKMHPSDAMHHARHVPGILPDALTQDAAAQVASAVNELGLHAEAVLQSEIPDFQHAETVHHVRCLDAGLEIVEVHGQQETVVSWSDVDLVSVGQVPQEDDRHYILSDEISAARRAATLDCFVARLPGPELWIVRREPLKAFRIDHERMNYEYLGDRKTASSTRNFRVFIGDVLEKAPTAYVTPATRAFVEHGPPRHYEFDSSDQLRRYTVFHLLIRRRANKPACDSENKN
jgi:hypothetical protein